MMQAGHSRQLEQELCSPVAEPNLCSERVWITPLTKAFQQFVNTCADVYVLLLLLT